MTCRSCSGPCSFLSTSSESPTYGVCIAYLQADAILLVHGFQSTIDVVEEKEWPGTLAYGCSVKDLISGQRMPCLAFEIAYRGSKCNEVDLDRTPQSPFASSRSNANQLQRQPSVEDRTSLARQETKESKIAELKYCDIPSRTVP